MNRAIKQTLPATLKRLYTIGAISNITKARGGYLSNNFCIQTNKGKYFLKQYRTELADTHVTDIHQAKHFFANGNIPVVLPFKTKNGRTFFEHKNYMYALFPWIDGVRVGKYDRLNRKAIQATATTLAHMHLLGRKKLPKIKTRSLPKWNAKTTTACIKDFQRRSQHIVDLITEKRSKNSFDVAAIKILKLKFTLLPTIPLYFNTKQLGKDHLLHGDFHLQNLFFNKDWEVKHIFDFEKSEIRPRSLEIIRSMLLICLDGTFTSSRFTLAKLYLRTYNNVYPIPKQELRQAILFSHYRSIVSLWIEERHYLEHNTRADEFLTANYRSLHYRAKSLSMFLKKLGL